MAQIDATSVGRVFELRVEVRPGVLDRIIYLRVAGVSEGAIEVSYHRARCGLTRGFIQRRNLPLPEGRYHKDIWSHDRLVGVGDVSGFIPVCANVRITDITDSLQDYPDCQLSVESAKIAPG